MSKILKTGLALLICSTVGCSSDVLKMKLINEVSISGIVTDGDTSSPVPGVVVKLEDKSAKTNTTGYYQIDNVTVGEYRFTATIDGYKNLSEIVDIPNKKVSDFKIYKSSSSTVAGSSSPKVTPTATPTATPTPTPTDTPTPTPTPSLDLASLASSLPSVLPSGVSSANLADLATSPSIKGKVVDDSNADLDGVTLTAKSLSSDKAYESTTVSASGAYIFTKVPAGVTIEITATKDGYNSRTKTIATASGTLVNDLNFGQKSDGTSDIMTALSNKPEIISVSPAYGATDVAVDTEFVIKFSRPMDPSTQNNFYLRNNTTNEIYLDSISQYDAAWNTDVNELTMTPKSGFSLPKGTIFGISFSNTGIKDTNGIAGRTVNLVTDDGCFRFTDGYKAKSLFTVVN